MTVRIPALSRGAFLTVDEATGEPYLRFTTAAMARQLDPSRDRYTVRDEDTGLEAAVELWRRPPPAPPGHLGTERLCTWPIPEAPHPSRCGLLVDDDGRHPDVPHVGVRVESLERGWYVGRLELRRRVTP